MDLNRTVMQVTDAETIQHTFASPLYPLFCWNNDGQCAAQNEM